MHYFVTNDNPYTEVHTAFPHHSLFFSYEILKIINFSSKEQDNICINFKKILKKKNDFRAIVMALNK